MIRYRNRILSERTRNKLALPELLKHRTTYKCKQTFFCFIGIDKAYKSSFQILENFFFPLLSPLSYTPLSQVFGFK